ncbi:MAG: hypothetical protein LBV57_02715 [Candidatus Symbiothrix sp.]|jgi:hypothetical protein|nr:hypothetical protein [Candidatus Symbiothrix sp.]
MKKTFLFVFAIASATILYGQENAAQTEYSQEVPTESSEELSAFNIGVLMGGGSLIGVDFEFLIPKSRLSLQAGVGISSFGAGFNYHLKDGINSSFVSLQYWNQGFGDNHYASYMGPMFVYRHKKLFQCGIGIGSIMDKGPLWKDLTEKQQKVTTALLYNIGLYF